MCYESRGAHGILNFASQELGRLRRVIDDLNATLFNPVGLNILWPGDVAFLYVSSSFPETEKPY